MYDKFLDMAEQHSNDLGYNIDAPRDFLKGRLESLVKESETLPWA